MIEVTDEIGLSRDMIIHPGVSLAEAIEVRDISQRELALRTGVTEKHISTVINGQKNISPAFARKLEYAIGIPASFWVKLQAHYDDELLDCEDFHSITKEEISVLDNLKDITDLLFSLNFLEETEYYNILVMQLRKVLGISNLLDIPKLVTASDDSDPYVLYGWMRLCEILTKDSEAKDPINTKKLVKRLPDIKKTMFMRSNNIQKTLTKIFASCGIAFSIVPAFEGAPVRGYIKKSEENPTILCLTFNQKYADVFWFNLYREIAHILNGDIKHSYIDFNTSEGKLDSKLDKKASEMLIDSKDYLLFVASKGYEKNVEVHRFAESQNVKDFIVEGKLLKDNFISLSDRTLYEWIS